MHCGWVGWETRVFSFQMAGMSVTQCFDTNRENIWTLLIFSFRTSAPLPLCMWGF